jgi:acyl-CoA reductase-like NAD-dependent aldehyde dehydrogenase
MAYVHHDVQHVARAARQIADSSFANSGQTCCAIKHVLVHQDALEQFCDRCGGSAVADHGGGLPACGL